MFRSGFEPLKISLVFVWILALTTIYQLIFDSELPVGLILLLLLFPIILSSGLLIKNEKIKPIQFFFIVYTLFSYLIPLFAFSYFPAYSITIQKYDATNEGIAKWIDLMLLDLSSIQVAILAGGYKYSIFRIGSA